MIEKGKKVGLEQGLGREKNLILQKKNKRDRKRDKSQGSPHCHAAGTVTGKTFLYSF